jgi:hypothetical protein
LVIVKVSVLTPPTTIGFRREPLDDRRRRDDGERVGAGVAGAAVGRGDTAVVLIRAPPVVAVTSTVTVQGAARGDGASREDDGGAVLPAAGAKVGAPQAVVVAFGVAATSRPAGNESVKATPVRAAPSFGLVIVNVSVLTLPRGDRIRRKRLVDARRRTDRQRVGAGDACAAVGRGDVAVVLTLARSSWR